jgi:uncharacterized protein YjbJ (UPF0337 family)
MNWDQIEAQWHQLAGQVKSEWARLTYADLKDVVGRRKQLAGSPQEHNSFSTNDGGKQIDA